MRSCQACQIIRELDPARVPISCDQCGQTDIMPENNEVIEAVLYRFQSLLVPVTMTEAWTVDYRSAMIISRLLELEPVYFLECCESIRSGLSFAPPRLNPDHRRAS